eukprot:1351315-Amorphochlora_amoeboformis.AAC.2
MALKTFKKLMKFPKKGGPGRKEPGKGKRPSKSIKSDGKTSVGRTDTNSAPMTMKDLLNNPSPTFQETPQTGRVRLFIDKLKLCCVMFDWTNEANQTDSRGIEIKRQILLELVDFVGKSKAVFSEHVVVEIMKMVKTNLFRTLPPKVIPYQEIQDIREVS